MQIQDVIKMSLTKVSQKVLFASREFIKCKILKIMINHSVTFHILVLSITI